MVAAKSQDRWSYLGYVAHSLAIAVVAMTWTGQIEYFHLASAVLVLLLGYMLLGYLRGFREVSANVDMVGHVFWDLCYFFVLFGLALFIFAFDFHLLLPGTEAFDSLDASVYTTWSSALITHDLGMYPTASSKAFLALFLLLSAIVLLNTIISILGDTYDRLRETQAAQGTRQRLQLLARMRRSPVQLHKAWRAVWGVGRWVAKCKRSAKALTSAQEEVLRKTKEGWNSLPWKDAPLAAEKLHAKIEEEQAEGAGANSIDVPSLEQTAAWLASYQRQKAEEAARRDDTEQGYMIVLKAVGASDGEDEDGAWAGRMRRITNEVQKQGGEQSRRSEVLEQQNTELKQQMEKQNKELKQQMEAMEQKMEQQAQKMEQQAQQLSAILAAVGGNASRR
jgi:vacuolar-type H+-ATPase subunit I/STV1